MRNRFFPLYSIATALFLGILLPAGLQAQTNDPSFDRFEQLMRRMEEQMRRGMPFDTTFDSGHLQISPDSNSFFYFHVDTSFNGMGNGFFDFSPFGGSDQMGFPDMGRLFDQFFNGMDPFSPRRNYGDLPADDGLQPDGADGLLPEERLRQQEENSKQHGKPAPKPDKATKSTVKTIRI